MGNEASRGRIVCLSGNLAILTCGRLSCAPLGDNFGTHQATGVAHHLLFPIEAVPHAFLPFDTRPTWAYPVDYRPALAFSVFSMRRFLPCLTVG